MTPSERVNIIHKMAIKLGAEEWPLIDLTLRQFGFPWTSEWDSGDKYGYVIKMVEEANDDFLFSLYNHIGLNKENKNISELKPTFWREGYFKLFVSHLASEKDKAIILRNNLLKYGISCFVAHEDIEPSKEWQNEIELALKTCDGLIALLHNGFHESKWTDQEIGYVLGRGAMIFSIKIDMDPYGFIGKYQAINEKNILPSCEKIFDLLISNKNTSAKMSKSVFKYFSESASFADAKERMSLIEKLQYWDSELEKLILEALNINSQIQESWRVKDRITAFNKKWKTNSV